MLAEIILIIHFIYVSFVVGGLLAVWIGAYFQWAWVRNFWFRALHLLAIMLVALESIFGVICPLTAWENALRTSRGGYQTSFVQYWIHEILFYTAPEYVFTVLYVLFTGFVVAAWFIVKPRRHG
jgi:hypothetical protein